MIDPKITKTTADTRTEVDKVEQITGNSTTTHVFRLVSPTSQPTKPIRQLKPPILNPTDKDVNDDDSDNVDIIYIPLDDSSNDSLTIAEHVSNTINLSVKDDEPVPTKQQRGNNGRAVTKSSQNNSEAMVPTVNATSVIKTTSSIAVEENDEIEAGTIMTIEVHTTPPAKTVTTMDPTAADAPTLDANSSGESSRLNRSLLAEANAVDTIPRGNSSRLSESLLRDVTNEETFFALSMAENLKRLSPKKRAEAKCHIIQYLSELEK